MKKLISLLILSLLSITSLWAQNIVAAEYYIDTDAGFGQNTPISLEQSDSDISQTFNIDLSDIGIGQHTLGTRVKDDQGRWSLVTNRPFLVAEVIPDEGSILAAEYFIDEDAGFGNNRPIPLTSLGDDITITFTVDLSTYEPGIHLLYARTMDVSGRWSIVSRMPFVVVDSTELSNIVALEYYYYDDDEEAIVGPDTLTYRFAEPKASIDEAFVANVEALASGKDYVLYVWAINEAGRRSLVSTTQFTYCNNIDNNCKPPFAMDLTVTNAGCVEGSSGKVAITASGGSGSYTYSLDNVDFVETNVFPDLTAGTYTAYVKSGDEVVSQEFNVIFATNPEDCPEPTGPAIESLVVTNVDCNTDDSGQVEIIATGGTGEYTYSIDNENYGSSSVIEGLTVGDYIAYVNDGNETVKQAFSVGAPPEIELVLDGEITPNNCEGPSGSFTVTASGGAGSGYEYSLDGTNFQESGTFSNLSDGVYDITVRDADGCTDTLEDIEVPFAGNRPETPVITSETDASVDSLSTEVILSVDNVTGVFQWYLNGEPIEGADSNQVVLTSGGDYTVTVTSDAGCQSDTSDIFKVTAVADEIASAIRVYPNPVTNELQIALPTAITGSSAAQVVLYDSQGRELIRRPVERAPVTTVDTQPLQPGIYLLRIHSREMVLQKKIQKH